MVQAMKKLIIIPAYNESENIVRTIEDIQKKAPDFDYVIINDCSTDDTGRICKEHGFNVINLPANLGIGGAVQTGYKYARLKDMILLCKLMLMGSMTLHFLENGGYNYQ